MPCHDATEVTQVKIVKRRDDENHKDREWMKEEKK